MTEPLTREEIDKIVADARAKGVQPNLRWANLRRAYLSRADLSWANLSGVDLRWANLSGANLRWADLSGANLSRANLSLANLSLANLSLANLSEAILSGVDLRWANLSGVDLSGANLSGANLRWADLSGATGLFATANLGRHDAIAAGGYIAIGCERHTYDDWLERGEEIGKANEYTDTEIARYMAWIELVVPWLKEEEAKR